jgi:hypothetical protein
MYRLAGAIHCHIQKQLSCSSGIAGPVTPHCVATDRTVNFEPFFSPDVAQGQNQQHPTRV